MQRPGQPPQDLPDPTPVLKEGWHCLHMFYRVCPVQLAALPDYKRSEGKEQLVELFSPTRADAPQRIQVSAVAGHKADLALMIMDPDPIKIDTIRQNVRASRLGTALVPSWSFVSLTEISEYVPTIEQYAARLVQEGITRDNPSFGPRLAAYEQRLPAMNRQRLYPEFPNWPSMCFYPMNKGRHPLANWYQEPFSVRTELMAEHATSGIQFAGKVSQLITSSTGLDDWEWGVTLWGRTPQYLKDIVYTMRFDRASARYGEFGPFYMSYVMSPADLMEHLRV